MHVTFDEAQRAIAAALRKAQELGTQMCIAVVDSGASLKAFARMNDAWVGSIDIAISACFFGMPTGQIAKLSQPGGSLFGVNYLPRRASYCQQGRCPHRGDWDQRQLGRERSSGRQGWG